MEDTLIIFSSVDGQTEKIANFIKSSSKRQEGIKIVSIKNIRFENLNEYKNIILGASIRYGKHCKKVYSFVSENKSLLDKYSKIKRYNTNLLMWEHIQNDQ